MKCGAAQTPCDESKVHSGSQPDSMVGASTAGQGAGEQVGGAATAGRQAQPSAHWKSRRSRGAWLSVQPISKEGWPRALCNTQAKGRAVSSSPATPARPKPTASRAADTEPRAIVHPRSPTGWEKEQSRC